MSKLTKLILSEMIEKMGSMTLAVLIAQEIHEGSDPVGFRRNPTRIRSFPIGSTDRIGSPGRLIDDVVSSISTSLSLTRNNH